MAQSHENSSGWSVWADKHFLVTQRNSSISKEFEAALTTFFTMSYILVVNPQVLYKIGLNPELCVASTALASAIGCLLTGFFGNLPFGLAPGIGLSAYLACGMVLGEGISLRSAFTTCFISAIILLVFTITNLSELLMKCIPRAVKVATIVGMGMQIALVGMTSVKLVVPNAQTIVGLGDMNNYNVWLALLGLVLIGTLLYHHVPGGILIGIFAMTILTWIIEDKFPTKLNQFVTCDIPEFHPSDFIGFDDFDLVTCLPGIAAFTFIGLIDVGGIIFGMGKSAGLLEADGTVPGTKATFMAVSLSSMVSAATGGTPLIVYVETAAGIHAGGRTGLTGVFIGLMFLSTLIVAPLLASIPVTATAPVAILIGTMMMSQAAEIDWQNMSEAIPAFLTASIIPFTFSITDGILFGLMAAFALYITTGQIFIDIKGFMYGIEPVSIEAESELTNFAVERKPSHGGIEAGVVQRDSPRAHMLRDRSASMHSVDSGHHRDRSSSFLDPAPFERIPSLILSKREVEAMKHQQS